MPFKLNKDDIDSKSGFLAIRHFPGKGRGVIVLKNIRAGTIIEKSPVIVVPEHQIEMLSRTVVGDFPFDWKTGEEDGEAILLGWGSLFNHSTEPNVAFCRDYEEKCITFYTLRRIKVGEELVYDYGDIWFESVENSV